MVRTGFRTVEGAIEAEAAKVAGLTHGALLRIEDWSAQVPSVSGLEVLLLQPAQPNDQVLLEIAPAIADEYELVACFGAGPGLGQAQILLEGKRVGEPQSGASEQAGLSGEVVLQSGSFVPRPYVVSLRSLDGKPVALDYLRFRKIPAAGSGASGQ